MFKFTQKLQGELQYKNELFHVKGLIFSRRFSVVVR